MSRQSAHGTAVPDPVVPGIRRSTNTHRPGPFALSRGKPRRFGPCRHLAAILCAALTLSACGGGSGSSGSSDGGGSSGGNFSGEVTAESQPPGFERWEEQMIAGGNRWGRELLDDSNSYNQMLGNYQYYDAQRIHYQIADYTGEAEPWNSYARAAYDVYSRYLTDNNFRTAGWMRFPHGLYMDWDRHGSSTAREYLLNLRDNPPFSDPTGDNNWEQQRYSREIAYSLETQMLAEEAGEARLTSRVDALVDLALQHVEIWTTGNFVSSDPGQQFTQAFMTGLTASALIRYYERSVEFGSPDGRVPDALETLADWLWENMWVENVNGTGHGAFSYVTPPVSGVGGESPAPDLSLLIAPLYGWLYRHNGEPRHLERGDAVFEGGVELADLGEGKRFNQSYRSSFNFVRWRIEGYNRFNQ